MDVESNSLLKELCFIASSRNAINTRRRRALWRKSYYDNAIIVVEAHNLSNYELRNLERKILNAPVNTAEDVHALARWNDRVETITRAMSYKRDQHPNPAKWKSMGLHKLRSLKLKAEAEYAQAKHETMEFTAQNRVRVQYLLRKLRGTMQYNNGFVEYIGLVGINIIDRKRIDQIGLMYELDKAVATMVEE